MKLEEGKTYLLSNGDIGVCHKTGVCELLICGQPFYFTGENKYSFRVRVASEIDSITYRNVPQRKLVKKGHVIFWDAHIARYVVASYIRTEKQWKQEFERAGVTFIRILEGVPEFPVEEVWEEV